MKMHTQIIHNTLYPLTPEYVNKELFKILNKISSQAEPGQCEYLNI